MIVQVGAHVNQKPLDLSLSILACKLILDFINFIEWLELTLFPLSSSAMIYPKLEIS